MGPDFLRMWDVWHKNSRRNRAAGKMLHKEIVHCQPNANDKDRYDYCDGDFEKNINFLVGLNDLPFLRR